MNIQMTAGDLCTREVVPADVDDELVDAARRMRECHVGTLVVVEANGGRRSVVGMLTDRDIVTAVVADGVDPASLKVGDVMSTRVVSAREDTSLIDLLHSMHAHGVRRVPVMGAQQELIGLVSRDDVLEVLAEALRLTVDVVSSSDREERLNRTMGLPLGSSPWP